MLNFLSFNFRKSKGKFISSTRYNYFLKNNVIQVLFLIFGKIPQQILMRNLIFFFYNPVTQSMSFKIHVKKSFATNLDKVKFEVE